MRQKKLRETMSQELQLAIGLVWGHMHTHQYEEAYMLALGCLKLWPQDRNLQLMAAYAAAEVLEPVDLVQLERLRAPDTDAWIDLILRRLQGQEAVPAM